MQSLRVFLSSTAEDLKAHREKVALAIEQMGGSSIRMETFGAQPGAPVQTCIDSVKRADILIVILAWRYGFVPTRTEGGDGASSMTSIEVQTALDNHVPVLAFVVDEAYAWPNRKEQDDLLEARSARAAAGIRKRVEALKDFKTTLMSRLTVKRFTTPEDLAMQVSTSLGRWLQERPVQAAEHVAQPVVSVDVMSTGAHDLCTLAYELHRHDAHLAIEPRLGYLDLLRAGGPIESIAFAWTPFHITPPTLDLKIVNNTQSTLFFSEVTFITESSRPDVSPVLILNGAGHGMQLPLLNIGFGRLQRCVLRFNLAAEEPIVDWDAAMPFECDASSALGDGRRIDLAPWFARLGVDVDVVRKDDSLSRHVVGGSHGPTLEEVRAAMAPFVQGFAYAWGWIEGNDAVGASFAVRFRTRLRLGEPLPEAPVPPSATYDAFLESARENYEMRVPISHEVSPGKVERFNIRVAAPAASRHRFRLRLRFNESGLVESQPIELHLFMTRCDIDLQHKQGQAPPDMRHPSGRILRRRAEP